jgi:transposase
VLSWDLLNFCKNRKIENSNISIPKLIDGAEDVGIIKCDEEVSRVTLWHWLRNMGVETVRKKRIVNNHSPQNEDGKLWLRKLLQGKIPLNELKNELNSKITDQDITQLFKCMNSHVRYRNRALSILALKKGIPIRTISEHLCIPLGTIYRSVKRYETKGIEYTISDFRKRLLKHKDQKYIDKVFSILHSPPSLFGINRTSWCQKDLKKVMEKSGFQLSQQNIRKIINDAGFNYRKAKTSLTSNDPNYAEKLKNITNILSNLGPKEKFFSIDEYGPFAIKLHGGRSLVPPGEIKSVPQWQKNKGSLIITAALELATNQITHFYSENKNTAEMIKLLNILIKKYADEECIYFSWDAASWHASKALFKRVDEINSEEYKKRIKSPIVKLAPLPTSAQFLNVIESVYSGMARAIIHNSDYQSVEECKAAINRYFLERNEKFQINPKRAGNKIWGKERVKAFFSETNCCKDPKYR